MAIVRDWEYATSVDTKDCTSCIGNSSVRKPDGSLMTSEEWCIEHGVCAGSIDWDKVHDDTFRTSGS